ncbi:oxygenase MpaB family protein [Rhodococcus sp. NPDC076796]|uniref:oxygenase MpaB family protein n=1 Tax=Rhodococcus sp. NPDC076796 TaxID=3154859 RepID=UPI00345006CF
MNTRAPSGLVRTDEAVSMHGQAGREWLDAMWRADPLADRVLDEDFGSSSSTAAVSAALTNGIDPDAPAALRKLFAFLDSEPDWVDHDRLDRAADALVRYSAVMGIVLGAASLLRGAENSIAGKPLAITGRYVSQPAIRSIEVGNWLQKVISPGGMARHGDGFAYTVRVRMIHAHVRRGIRHLGTWDDEAWGVPIPQPYMAFTIAEFGHIALDAMHRVGVRFTDTELGDIYHLWRYVGHVVGVDHELNPIDESDHIRIEQLYRLTSPGPSQDDRDFVAALTDDYLVPELANLLPGPHGVTHAVASATMSALQRVLIGDEASDDLHIPASSLKHVVSLVGPLLPLVNRARTLRAGGPSELTRRSYLVRDAEMQRMRAGYRVTHELVDDVHRTHTGS